MFKSQKNDWVDLKQVTQWLETTFIFNTLERYSFLHTTILSIYLENSLINRYKYYLKYLCQIWLFYSKWLNFWKFQTLPQSPPKLGSINHNIRIGHSSISIKNHVWSLLLQIFNKIFTKIDIKPWHYIMSPFQHYHVTALFFIYILILGLLSCCKVAYIFFFCNTTCTD